MLFISSEKLNSLHHSGFILFANYSRIAPYAYYFNIPGKATKIITSKNDFC